MPSIAHRKRDSEITDVSLQDVAVGDTLVVYPHDICPADGIVIEGHGAMDESYLYRRAVSDYQNLRLDGNLWRHKPGNQLSPFAQTKCVADSRYAKIMEVMRESEDKRPQLRRLGDKLGAIYTPLALAVAFRRLGYQRGSYSLLLAVLVIATPCPLLIAIPIAIIGSISLCARRAIIVKSPVVLEQIAECRTADIRQDRDVDLWRAEAYRTTNRFRFRKREVLTLVASLEVIRKHPLARAILEAAKKGRDSVAGMHRGERATWKGTARDRVRPGRCKSQAASSSLHKKLPVAISFHRSPVDLSAWW